MSILNDMLETGLHTTQDFDTSFSSVLYNYYDICEISDEFKMECENLIINFMVQANTLLTEQEIATKPIGHNLWMSLSRSYNDFADYQHGDKLKEVVEKFYGLDLGSKLNKAIKR